MLRNYHQRISMNGLLLLMLHRGGRFLNSSGLSYTNSILKSFDAFLKIGLTAFILWNAFNPLPGLQERSLFLLLVLTICFMHNIIIRDVGIPRKMFGLFLIICTIVSFGYVFLNHDAILRFTGDAPGYTSYLGLLAIFVLLVGTRIVTGWALTLIISATVLYGFYGHWLPMEYGGHVQLSLGRLMNTVYLSTEGIFGVVAFTMMKYVYLFVFFGKLMGKLGALDFIINFSLALFGKVRGGPAMVASVASGFMGSVNGSAVANVMVTGAISIPMMKRVGFKPEFAGGVEASASTGGQFLPPVMGATAFLIATFLGIQYIEVVKAAIIPSVLFYVALLVSIYIYARKSNVGLLPRDELPGYKDVAKDINGLTFMSGITTLVWMLVIGYSPIMAVMAACVVMTVISMVSKNRLTLRKSVEVFKETSEDFVTIGTAGSAIGILMAMLLITGLVVRFSGLVLNFAGDNLLLVLVLTAMSAIIIGFGLPTVLTYVILSIMAIPVLVRLDVDPLAAHMFVFFTGIIAMVTPPVALSSMAASTIANSNFWKTSMIAFRLSLPALILPFFFVLEPSLLMQGTFSEIAIHTLYALVGVCLMSLALTGATVDKLEFLERSLLFIAAILFLFPSALTSGATVLLVFIAFARKILAYMARRAQRLLGSQENKDNSNQ